MFKFLDVLFALKSDGPPAEASSGQECTKLCPVDLSSEVPPIEASSG